MGRCLHMAWGGGARWADGSQRRRPSSCCFPAAHHSSCAKRLSRPFPLLAKVGAREPGRSWELMPFVKVMDAASRGRGKGCLPSRPARQSNASNTGARNLGDGFIFFLNRRAGKATHCHPSGLSGNLRPCFLSFHAKTRIPGGQPLLTSQHRSSPPTRPQGDTWASGQQLLHCHSL